MTDVNFAARHPENAQPVLRKELNKHEAVKVAGRYPQFYGAESGKGDAAIKSTTLGL